VERAKAAHKFQQILHASAVKHPSSVFNLLLFRSLSE
jgi:hypothetical protein